MRVPQPLLLGILGMDSFPHSLGQLVFWGADFFWGVRGFFFDILVVAGDSLLGQLVLVCCFFIVPGGCAFVCARSISHKLPISPLFFCCCWGFWGIPKVWNVVVVFACLGCKSWKLVGGKKCFDTFFPCQLGCAYLNLFWGVSAS